MPNRKLPAALPADPISKLRWGAEKRLEFIELKAYWEGSVNRRDITEAFSVSVPQASSDLAEYQRIAPANLEYNASAKRYTSTQTFVHKVTKPDAERHLAQLAAASSQSCSTKSPGSEQPPVVDRFPIPKRPVDPEVLRVLLAAVRGTRSVEIEYCSMNATASNETWRRISPHAFGYDGFRWHVRAWCHRDRRFKDFLLSRCCGVRKLGDPDALAIEDVLWSTFFSVRLVPNPALSVQQRRAVELDYGMTQSRVELSVRLASLYYFDKHIKPGSPGKTYSLQEARWHPIVVDNWDAYAGALRKVSGS